MRLKILLAGVTLATLSTAANAAVITRTFDINASNFTLQVGAGAPPPISPVHLNFTATWDNSTTFGGTTSGLTINSFNLPYPAQFAYSAVGDTLVIATSAFSGGCNNPANTFCGFISAASGTPSLSLFQQSTSSGGYWSAQTRSITGVPEPQSWALMIGGFGLAGSALRYRRRRTAVSFA